MQLKKISINKKYIVYISFHTDYDAKILKSVDKLLDMLINQIHLNQQIGYAGFYTKKALRSQLIFNIFGKHYRKEQQREFPAFPFKKTEILHELTLILKKCLSMLPAKSTWIFVFPTFDPFIKNKMGGIGGFTPWKHTIWLTLHPQARRWKGRLRATLAHEFNHSVRLHYFPLSLGYTLLDAIIFEGLADNFTQQIIYGRPSPWTTTLSLKGCRKIFQKIKKRLTSKDRKIYYSLFFEGRQYPLWSGYSIGYQIVKKFLKNNKDLDWKELMKLKSEEILKRSGFF